MGLRPHCHTSIAIAMPMPPLTQSVASPRRSRRRRSSWTQGDQDARAGAADRVAERNGAAVHVQALRRDGQVLQHGEDLRRERLVQLDQIEVLDLQRRSLAELPHRRHRADPHDARIHARRRPSHDACDRLHAERARVGFAREDERGGAVGDARRGARGDDSGRALDRRERSVAGARVIRRRVGPRMLVGREPRPALSPWLHPALSPGEREGEGDLLRRSGLLR